MNYEKIFTVQILLFVLVNLYLRCQPQNRITIKFDIWMVKSNPLLMILAFITGYMWIYTNQ